MRRVSRGLACAYWYALVVSRFCWRLASLGRPWAFAFLGSLVPPDPLVLPHGYTVQHEPCGPCKHRLVFDTDSRTCKKHVSVDTSYVLSRPTRWCLHNTSGCPCLGSERRCERTRGNRLRRSSSTGCRIAFKVEDTCRTCALYSPSVTNYKLLAHPSCPEAGATSLAQGRPHSMQVTCGGHVALV